jgi:hypothetical protein
MIFAALAAVRPRSKQCTSKLGRKLRLHVATGSLQEPAYYFGPVVPVMAEIHVRLINGESLAVRCSDQINVKQLRELLAEQKPKLASCQLFRNVGYLL